MESKVSAVIVAVEVDDVPVEEPRDDDNKIFVMMHCDDYCRCRWEVGQVVSGTGLTINRL